VASRVQDIREVWIPWAYGLHITIPNPFAKLIQPPKHLISTTKYPYTSFFIKICAPSGQGVVGVEVLPLIN